MKLDSTGRLPALQLATVETLINSYATDAYTATRYYQGDRPLKRGLLLLCSAVFVLYRPPGFWRATVPTKQARLCRVPSCPNLTTDKTGYCPAHAHLYVPFARRQDSRPSAARRGYDRAWHIVRAEVLRAHGIPPSEWHRYDVDHNPPYNALVEPDHRKYKLVPRLHGDHSRKTSRENRGWGGARTQGGVKSSQPSNIDRRDESTFFAQEFLLKGSEA